MERRIGPADCALAIALPLTWGEFVADSTSPERDFVRSVVDGCGRTIRETWLEVYEPHVIRTSERVFDRVSALGGTVVLGATINALRELLTRFSVVCLVAHSSFPSIKSDDVVNSAEILHIIRTGESPAARYLRRRFDDQISTLTCDSAHALAAFLESSIEATRLWSASVSRRGHYDAPEAVMNRVILEDCFGGAIRRAHVIELRDGMQTTDALVSTIPTRFRGVLELSICNSVAIGESIKRRRRSCLVVANSFQARIDFRLARFALVMKMLAERPARYTDVLCELCLELMGDQ